MPLLLLLLLVTTTAAIAQPIVLLDKELKEPLTVVTPSNESVGYDYFPIYMSDIDSIMKVSRLPF